MAQVNIEESLKEFSKLKTENIERNRLYYHYRQAVKGNFLWPKEWPAHIPKLKHNFCRAIVRKQSAYLMGRGFTFNIDRPNSIEYRDAAERAEKVLSALLEASNSDVQFASGAKNGSLLGRTVFRVYEKGEGDAKHACFANCTPDYFYGIPAGADRPGEFSRVYYSYPLDIEEAERIFGKGHKFKTEGELSNSQYHDRLPDERFSLQNTTAHKRRVPLLEIWTPDAYAIIVGGEVVYNGDNKYKWKSTGEGYIPFVVAENVRNDEEGYGESDIAQAVELNETYNQIISRRQHVVSRWLAPTLVWEGAPQNAAEILTHTIAGGGHIPMRMGGRISFLAYDRPNPLVSEQLMELRQSILETSGMNEPAYAGIVTGSINTGPALDVQFQPILSVVDEKRKEWTSALTRLYAILLDTQERIGDSTVLPEVVVGATRKSKEMIPGVDGGQGAPGDGQLVQLSGTDIQGLRRVTINWPGVLPKDSYQGAQLEMAKAAQGFQSIYTTLEKLGEEHPDDEIARIRMENEDPSLRGQKVAEQTKANMPLMMEAMRQQSPPPPPQEGAPPPLDSTGEGEPSQVPEGDKDSTGARIREMMKARQAKLDVEGEFPSFSRGGDY